MSIKNKDKEVDSDASDKDNQNTQVIPLNGNKLLFLKLICLSRSRKKVNEWSGRR